MTELFAARLTWWLEMCRHRSCFPLEFFRIRREENQVSLFQLMDNQTWGIFCQMEVITLGSAIILTWHCAEIFIHRAVLACMRIPITRSVTSTMAFLA